VLIGPDGHLRVMDFGVAGGHADQGEPGLYQPPEQFYQNPPDQTADVYAVGGILYQLLSGHAPFRVGTPDLEARIRNGDFAPLATLAPGLPPGLVDVVRGMMATQVPQRLQTAAGARERLLGYASATSGASSSVE
jgi:serine/threonine-protein kinase